MRYEIEGDTLVDIADAIRSKTKTSKKYYPSEMASIIRNFSGNSTLINKDITQNGIYNPAEDDVDGYNKVTVNVPSAANLQVKNITENGVFNPDTGYGGFSSVIVNVSYGEDDSWHLLMTNGQVSNTSDYKTAYFDSGVDIDQYNIFAIILYRIDKQEGTIITMPSSIPSKFNIPGNGYTYEMQLTTDSIRCSHYSGAYVNLYVDVYGFKLPTFPPVEPYFIQIAQLPNTTPKIYTDGETIKLTNMEVTAYTAAMDVWGTIPLSEIIIETPKAVYDSSKDTGNYTNGNGVNATYYVSDSTSTSGYFYNVTDGFSITTANAHFFMTIYNGILYCASATESNYGGSASMRYKSSNGTESSLSINIQMYQTFSAPFSTAYDWVFPVAESTSNPQGIDHTTMELVPAGSAQTITISWNRPGDGLKLSTTFEVQVSPPST